MEVYTRDLNQERFTFAGPNKPVCQTIRGPYYWPYCESGSTMRYDEWLKQQREWHQRERRNPQLNFSGLSAIVLEIPLERPQWLQEQLAMIRELFGEEEEGNGSGDEEMP